MASFNRVILIGNLTRDPELRFTPRGAAVCDISIACNRKWKDESGNAQEEVTFVDITLWAKLAETCAQYLRKGSSACFEGRLQQESWQDKDSGQKRSKLKVVAEQVQFLGSPNRDGQQAQPQQQAPRQQAARPSLPPQDTGAPDGDDIPF